MINIFSLLHYIPKNSFTGVIIPKTKFIFCDITSYYNESREVVYFGTNNVNNFANIERSIDSLENYQENIEILNSITTDLNKSKSIIYEKININFNINDNFSVITNYSLFLDKYNILNISNHKTKVSNNTIIPLNVGQYYQYNNKVSKIFKFIENESK
jgi:hypothetical protein